MTRLFLSLPVSEFECIAETYKAIEQGVVVRVGIAVLGFDLGI